jgi:hypothetical protein
LTICAFEGNKITYMNTFRQLIRPAELIFGRDKGKKITRNCTRCK